MLNCEYKSSIYFPKKERNEEKMTIFAKYSNHAHNQFDKYCYFCTSNYCCVQIFIIR